MIDQFEAEVCLRSGMGIGGVGNAGAGKCESRI